MMTSKWNLLAVAVAFFLLNSIAIAQTRPNKKFVDFRNPPRQYVSKEYQGRTYRLESSLVRDAPDVAQKALIRLHANIDKVLKKYPAHATADLSAIRFYIMHGPDAVGGGRPSGMAFIRDKQPERKNHLDLAWSNSIIVYSGKNYATITDLWAQKGVAHEMAHAYHLHRWPEKQPEILAAYKAAMDRKLYQKVRNNKGGTTEKAYATVNQLEYFAELSCMYFFECNYEPTNKRKLKLYDPNGYDMIEEMWAVRLGSKPPKNKLDKPAAPN